MCIIDDNPATLDEAKQAYDDELREINERAYIEDQQQDISPEAWEAHLRDLEQDAICDEAEEEAILDLLREQWISEDHSQDDVCPCCGKPY